MSRKKEQIQVDWVVAWAMWKTKAPLKKIAEKFNMSIRGVYYHIQKVNDAVKERIDINELKNAVLLCYPSALESLMFNLNIEHDPSVTNNFLNKTVFADVKENEFHANTNIFNLGAGISQELRGVEPAKLQAISAFLRNGDRKTGEPALVSRIESPSDN